MIPAQYSTDNFFYTDKIISVAISVQIAVTFSLFTVYEHAYIHKHTFQHNLFNFY